MNESTIAWIAGLLEGEGMFRWNVHKKQPGCPYLKLEMTDRDVVERAAKILDPEGHYKIGASTRTRGGKVFKTCYRLQMYGAHAVRVMKMIRSFMGDRRGQKIDETLAMWRAKESA